MDHDLSSFLKIPSLSLSYLITIGFLSFNQFSLYIWVFLCPLTLCKTHHNLIVNALTLSEYLLVPFNFSPGEIHPEDLHFQLLIIYSRSVADVFLGLPLLPSSEFSSFCVGTPTSWILCLDVSLCLFTELDTRIVFVISRFIFFSCQKFFSNRHLIISFYFPFSLIIKCLLDAFTFQYIL